MYTTKRRRGYMKYTIIFIVILTALAFVFFGCNTMSRTIHCGKEMDAKCCREATNFTFSGSKDFSVAYQICMLRKELKSEAERF